MAEPPATTQGPVGEYLPTSESTPPATQGPVGEYLPSASGAPPTTQGPVVEATPTGLPLFAQGPGLQHESAVIAPFAQGPGIQHGTVTDPLLTPAQGPGLQHAASTITSASPVIGSTSAIQRDTAASFLVDVKFEVTHPTSQDLSAILVEWSRGSASGPFLPALAQTLDRQHDAVAPVTGLPTSAPGKFLNFVWQAFFDLPKGSFTDVFLRLTVTSNPSATTTIGPLSISTVSPSQPDLLAQAQARRALKERTPLDFLGCGLVIPFRRGSRDFVNDCEVELVRAAVSQILGTRAAHGDFLGDLRWRPDFGNKLWVLRHRQNDPTLQGQAVSFVLEALRSEPRVQVTEVLPEVGEPNELRIRVKYQIISVNVDDNRVLLPEFEEVVRIAA